jgi:hypothetical protein
LKSISWEGLKIIGANHYPNRIKFGGQSVFEDFSPPDKGLNPGEEVVWSQRAGMGAKIMIGGTFCLVFWPWVILLLAGWFGPIFVNAAIIFFFLVILITILDFVNSRRTRFYFTTERIVEARGGLIRTQIPLKNFQEAEDEVHIKVRSTYREGAKQFYEVRLKDPESGKILMLTGMDEDARDTVLGILKPDSPS